MLTWPGGAGPLTWCLPGILRGGTYLWYLSFLLVFHVVALPLRRVPRLPVALGLLLVSELLPDGTEYLERPCYLMALFLVGWWIAEDPARLRAVASSRPWWRRRPWRRRARGGGCRVALHRAGPPAVLPLTATWGNP